MMLSRQLDSINAIIEQAPNMPSFVKTIEMQKGYVDVLHQHCWHQLIFPLQGLLQTEANEALFWSPIPQRFLCLQVSCMSLLRLQIPALLVSI